MAPNLDNLSDALERAATVPTAPGIGYLHENGHPEMEPYSALLQRASGVLTSLHERGLAAGDHIILSASRNEDFVAVFWACVLGGMIPAPLAPPRALQGAGHALEKMVNAWELLDGPHVVIDDPVGEPIPPDRQILTGSLCEASPSVHSPNLHKARPDDTAFIQFSSGSTGQPKGVVITHRNILANGRAIARGLGVRDGDAGLNWMPLFHDFGLVGFHLAAIISAKSQFQLPARSFIRSPLLWLDCLERHRATITACPNFGYSLVLGKMEDQPECSWDLSHVRVILNGAEPIAVGLMNRFLDRLATHGLKPTAMFPVYGLAEATLAVSFPALETAPTVVHLDRESMQKHLRAVDADSDAPGIDLVMEGSAIDECEIRVVGEDGCTVPDSTIGHIQIRGANVTAGYFRNAAANREAFCEASDGAGRWLRTGDQGFLRNHQLCVTGRTKDILFANGCNYWLHDLENAARMVEGVAAERVALCAYRREGAERDSLLLFLACRKIEEALPQFLEVRRKLQSACGVPLDAMIPLKPGEFPKTTSGKLQRHKLCERYAAGAFDAGMTRLAELIRVREAHEKTPPVTAMERLIHRIWCEQMVRPPESVGIHDSFEELGGTSLDLFTVLRIIEQRLGFRVHSEQLADHRTISEFAAFLEEHAVSLSASRGGGRYFKG